MAVVVENTRSCRIMRRRRRQTVLSLLVGLLISLGMTFMTLFQFPTLTTSLEEHYDHQQQWETTTNNTILETTAVDQSIFHGAKQQQQNQTSTMNSISSSSTSTAVLKQQQQQHDSHQQQQHQETVVVVEQPSSFTTPGTAAAGADDVVRRRKSPWIHRNHNPNETSIFVPVQKNDIIMGGGISSSPFVLEKYKLVFFTIQKCGGTVWKQLFRRMAGYKKWRTKQKRVPVELLEGVRQLKDYPLNEATRIMNDPTYIRAIMVRDPKERYLSAYLDKAVQENYFTMMCCGYLRTTWEEPCKEKFNVTSSSTSSTSSTSSSCNDMRYICKNRRKINISLEKFISATAVCHDNHWEPQSMKLDDKYYKLLDFVGHLETSHDDAKELLVRVGAWDEFGSNGWGIDMNESIFYSTSFVKHKTSSTKDESKSRLSKYYTPELELQVEQRLKSDYEISQFDLPLTKISYGATTKGGTLMG